MGKKSQSLYKSNSYLQHFVILPDLSTDFGVGLSNCKNISWNLKECKFLVFQVKYEWVFIMLKTMNQVEKILLSHHHNFLK